MKSKYAKEIRKQKKIVKEMFLDLTAIADEHDQYAFNNQAQIDKWMNSFLISSVKDSIAYDKNELKPDHSIRYMHHRPKLRRLYDEMKLDLELEESKLVQLKIDQCLESIEEISKNV